MPSPRISLKNSFFSLTFAFITIFVSSCTQKGNKVDGAIKRQLQVVDSLYIAGKNDSTRLMLANLRPRIDASSPLICTYYCMMVENFINNAALKNTYADSALAFFSSETRIKEYPAEYFNALITKGDACLNSAKYISALNYYYDSKKVLSLGVCDNGDLDSKMGVIYYGQKNYQLAAKYWASSYRHLGLCNDNINAQKLFFMKQGALDNTGFAYQKAGLLDSANDYYLQDLKLIDETGRHKLIEKKYLNDALAVVYDNMGGLNLMKGHLDVAKQYLDKCIAFPNSEASSRIPPYTKLAELYMRMGDMAKAADAFAKSKLLLDHFPDAAPETLIKWNKLYSEYLLKLNDAAGAYHYLANYNRIKDSINNNNADLYRLDVVRELNAIQQKQALAELKQKDNFRQIYLAGIAIIIILFIVIIGLVYRNLKKTRKTARITTLQNSQLQHTLSELERVNKNYIRIMRVMAHDLRNPLSGMTGLASVLLEEEEFSEDSKHMLKLIETTGLHSMEMINELLKSGLADENEKLVKQKLDLKALIYDSVELLQFKANDKQQQIIFESDNTPIITEVNHEKIWRVINNLIVNAIKFSHTGGVIKVGIKHDQKHIFISVADNGIGIPEDQKDIIFEMFTPAKKAGTDGEQPFGLGLSISKRIVEMHKGKIWFESIPDKGTTFFIQLPLSI